jgi:hypothetical protein
MTIEIARQFLLWCSIINYGILILWFLWFAFAHDTYRGLLERAVRVKGDQFDALNYWGMTIYKLGILLFNIVPWIALSLVK